MSVDRIRRPKPGKTTSVPRDARQSPLGRSANAGTESAGVASAPPIVHDALARPGQPLDHVTRSYFEPRLRTDLGAVRVHDDDLAHASAQAVEAAAYAVGSDVVFAHGRHAPQTARGRRLLAHELAHVTQHEASPARPVLRRQDPARADVDVVSGGGVPTLAPILPGYSQRGDTCGASSLVTALMIWDREHPNPSAPNATVVTACNLLLVELSRHRSQAIATWEDRAQRQGTTGEALYDAVVRSVTRIRDAASARGAVIAESDYQTLGLSLYFLWNEGRGGLSVGAIHGIQAALGLQTTSSAPVESFDQIFASSILRGLAPDRIAQVGWYVRTSQTADGRSRLGHHVFLVGRLADGTWFLSDQGETPARQFTGSSVDELATVVRTAAATGGSWIFTGGVTEMSMVLVGGWTGVSLLGERGGVEARMEGLVPSGRFLGEVDEGLFTGGDRVEAREYLGRFSSRADASAAATGSGGWLIVELPAGVFTLYRTTPVRDANLSETGLDVGDSSGGLLLARTFLHAWLVLGNAAGRRGSTITAY